MERLHPFDRPAFEHTVERAARDRHKYSHEYRIVLPDGSIRMLHSVAQPLVNASGDLEFIGTVMDITERRSIEESLRSAQAELARTARLTTMGQLLASIAHEIKQPLAAVVIGAGAAVRWLDRDPPDYAEARNSLLQVAIAGKSAAQVIDSIRAMTKKAEPHFVTFDIKSTIEEALALVRGELQRHDVIVKTRFDLTDCEVYADKVQLQQVLLNIVMNGIDAMSSVLDRPRALDISGQLVEPSCLLVKIEDTGMGIDSEIASHMFEAFHTTKPHGMGIGLSICRSIIEAHGGRIWAAPRAPHGAVFCFTIPTACADRSGLPLAEASSG